MAWELLNYRLTSVVDGSKTMQISASTFSDPAMRPGLEQYYEQKKAELYESLKARPALPEEIRFTTADGTEHIAKAIPISAEKMVASLVGFDKWLEFQAESFAGPFGRRTNPALPADSEFATRMQSWQQQHQSRMNEIGSFLLGLQESEPA